MYDFFACQITTSQGYFEAPTQQHTPSNGIKVAVDWNSCVWKSLADRGISLQIAEGILNSWRSGTRKQSSSAWKKWTLWCNIQY
ncbi:hypothetical protein DPMN_000190 [Dreissena polymorpha]|uniref:Uncharacterized protein n=1 Tax=Dreissena polymorpha TaxID=45954 RepID=A0A9D4MFC6_DREPO|nr:hypothetical protein DPMN_000190 [Dreissena polymorpha]